jgi:hypothetical protein
VLETQDIEVMEISSIPITCKDDESMDELYFNTIQHDPSLYQSEFRYFMVIKLFHLVCIHMNQQKYQFSVDEPKYVENRL